MSTSVKRAPKIVLPWSVYRQCGLWAQLASQKLGTEFSCLGRTSIDEDGDVWIDEVFLVKQECTSTDTDMDDQAKALLFGELWGKRQIGPDQLLAWVHSHPGTGPSATYLSATDTATIDRQLKTAPWYASVVLDASGGNPYGRIDWASPRVGVETDVIIAWPRLTEETIGELTAEFTAKVSKAAPMTLRLPGAGKSDGGPKGPIADTDAGWWRDYTERYKRFGSSSALDDGGNVLFESTEEIDLAARLKDNKISTTDAVIELQDLGYSVAEAVDYVAELSEAGN